MCPHPRLRTTGVDYKLFHLDCREVVCVYVCVLECVQL